MIEAATQYRTLSPRATLTGGADSLANVIVAPFPEGALCWVIAENSLWRLAKASLASVSATVIATSKGAGVPGRWIEYGAGGGGGSNLLSVTLDEEITTVISGPLTYEPMGNLDIELAAGFESVTALLVVNSNNNAGGAIALRITYTLDGSVWTPLPGAALQDEDSSINRRHLSVLGTFTGAAIGVRGEWSAYGDSGSWTIPADATGSASLAAWQA